MDTTQLYSWSLVALYVLSFIGARTLIKIFYTHVNKSSKPGIHDMLVVILPVVNTCATVLLFTILSQEGVLFGRTNCLNKVNNTMAKKFFGLVEDDNNK